MTSVTRDDRGVSEFAGVAILVSMTVLATASVGLFVLVEESDAGGPPEANFSFQYVDQSSILLVTHERGDSVDAGNLTVQSQDAQAPWNALAGSEPTTVVGPGATVQLSGANAYGENVNRGDRIRVVYTPPSGNMTVLETWDG
jgi:FlaG/FlaF family flagellin (archaellin)